MGPRTGAGVLCLGLLAASCGGGDERALEALIDEIEAIHAETIATMEEKAKLAIERVSMPRGNPCWFSEEELESMASARQKEQQEYETRQLDTERQRMREQVAWLRDLLERDAWEEVQRDRRIPITPISYVGSVKEVADRKLVWSREMLATETSGVSAAVSSRWAGNPATSVSSPCNQ